MTTRSFSLLVGLAHILGGRPGWRERPEHIDRTKAQAKARRHANRRRKLALQSKRRNRGRS